MVVSLVLVATLQGVAAAQPVVAWTAGTPAQAGRAELWARRVQRALERDGAQVLTDSESWAYPPPGISRANLEVVQAIELLLFLSRTRASDLDERGALAALVEAERLGESAVAFEGGTAWYAEVEVQIAITAFQLGQPSLARAALERAASLDPGRVVRAAEAPPELVQLARRAVLSARAAPVSSFEVRVLGGPTEARVFVDDDAAGGAPARVQVGAGLHALRIEADGYRPWATLLRVLPGTREPIEVVLALQPSVELARELARAVADLDLEAVPALLQSLAEHGVVLERLVLTAVGEGAFDRALMIGCDRSRCRVAQRLEGDVPADRARLGEDAEPRLDAALGWLEEVPELVVDDDVEGPSVWEEPWPWVVLGGVAAAALAGGIAGAVLAEEPSRNRSFVINVPLP